MFSQYYLPKEFHQEVVMSLFSIYALLTSSQGNLHMVEA